MARPSMLTKIRAWHNHRLLFWLQNFNLALLPVAVFLLTVNFSWLYLTMTLVSLLAVAKIGHSVAQHRYFCHRSFATTSGKEWLLAVLSVLSTTHSPVYYSAVHRYHHAHSDSNLDPHCPWQLGKLACFLGSIDQTKVQQIPKTIVKDLIKKPAVMWAHNWYWPVLISYWIVLLVIDPWLWLFCYVIPCAYVKIVTGTQLSIGHTWGYRNYETQDHSINNRWWNWITLGEGLHNNHHARPNEYNFAYANHAGEWDLSKWLVEWLFLSKTPQQKTSQPS